MNRNDANDIIQSTFLSKFETGVPVALDNASFDTPEGEWVGFQVKFQTGGQSTLGIAGNRRGLRSGTILITVNVPLYSSTFRAEELAEKALNIFDGKSIGGISFFDGTYSTFGEAGKWYQVIAILGFWYYEIK
jgi:hypothetical protein